MPALRLWGRRWHFTSDVVPIPAAINAFFHGVWVFFLLFGAIGSGQWPRGCDSASGRQYVAVFAGLFAAFVVNLVLDVLLFFQGLKGAPFEVSKRRWVPILLHISTIPIVAQLVFTAYGTHVVSKPLEDCWPEDVRHSVHAVAVVLVYSTWGLMAIITLGILITYNLYPEHGTRGSWEQRCECISLLLCCRGNMRRRPSGRRPPLANIAELSAGLLSHVDMEATDLMTAVILTSAAQNRRRRLRLAKALLPVYEALQSTSTSRDSDGEESGDEELEHEGSGGGSSDDGSVNGVPISRRLTRRLAAAAAGTAAPDAASAATQGPACAGAQAARVPAELATPAGRFDDLANGLRSRRGVTFEELVAPARPTPPDSPPKQLGSVGSLPLTEGNLALVDALISQETEEVDQAAAVEEQQEATAAVATEVVARELRCLASSMGQDAPELAEALADAIQDELDDIGAQGSSAMQEDAVLHINRAPSLSLALLASDHPTIWIAPSVATRGTSRHSADSSSSPPEDGAGEARSCRGQADTLSGADALPDPDDPASCMEASVPAPPFVAAGDPLPSREEVEAAVATGGHSSRDGSAVSPGSAGGGRSEGAGAGGDLSNVTLRLPTVITPSQYVGRLAGKLPADALAEIYAGRHEHVDVEALEEATYYLKYAYAVYSLQPTMDNPGSMLDILCWKPPAPQDVVFSGFNELEQLEDDTTIELLHLNCSNRMLAHLPYLIALDHDKQAVVLAIRGTISAADIVTDAMVASERLEGLLPASLAADMEGPCFGHAGMAAAAQAIFTDMRERGILAPLVGGAAAADDYTAPRGQGSPTRESQYDADAGPSAVQEAMSRATQAVWRGVAAIVPGATDDGQAAQATDVDCDVESPPFSISQDGPRVTVVREDEQLSPGQKIGKLMKEKLVKDGWQLMVVGHSLGAGAAALISLQLLDHCPGLRCIAYSCPGALVSKNLSHAMAKFTTTVVVGKDAVPRASVANMGRLMDEMVTFYPWWKKRKQDYKNLFWDYDKIPEESLQVLRQYYDSRVAGGQPIGMYPPGRIIFVRPMKTRKKKAWDCVWISPEDLIDEGILLSPHMLTDHLCGAAWEALHESLKRAKDVEHKPANRKFDLRVRFGRHKKRHYKYDRQTSEQRNLEQELIAE